ncbi:MAG: hypothetical protein ACJ72W_15520 [Actinoallomurus sp.]
MDLLLDLEAPDRTHAQIVVEAKSKLDPRDVETLLRHLARYERTASAGKEASTGLVVAAPHLSRRTRELLAEADVGWYDSTGNLHLQLERPALYIERQGADRNPYPPAGDRRLRSLRGPGAARVIRALLDNATPMGVRELAAAADVGAATSSRVLDLISREGLIERDATGAVNAVRKRSLVQRWAEDYGLMTTNNPIPMLAPRGIDQTMRELGTFSGSYSITAEAALRAHLPDQTAAVAPTSLLTVYVDDVVSAQEHLKLRQVSRGSNVMLVEPFDEVVYRGSRIQEGIRYVNPSQTVVDLLTGPGRSAEEGQQLIDILASEEVEWTR